MNWKGKDQIPSPWLGTISTLYQSEFHIVSSTVVWYVFIYCSTLLLFWFIGRIFTVIIIIYKISMLSFGLICVCYLICLNIFLLPMDLICVCYLMCRSCLCLGGTILIHVKTPGEQAFSLHPFVQALRLFGNWLEVSLNP